MLILRVLGVVLAFGAVACSQPAPSAPEAPAAPASEAVALDALTPAISAEIGRPVVLQVTTSNISGGWAYIVAQPANADGSAIDWSATNLASRHENGVMDESGAVHALLRQSEGAWVIVEHVIAPTDVAWIDWAERHNVPPGVIEAPPPPAP